MEVLSSIFFPFKWLFKILNDIVKSFYNNKEGFAWRKVHGTYCLYIPGQIGLDYCKRTDADPRIVLAICCLFVIAMFILIGLLTFPELIKAWNNRGIKEEKNRA